MSEQITLFFLFEINLLKPFPKEIEPILVLLMKIDFLQINGLIILK